MSHRPPGDFGQHAAQTLRELLRDHLSLKAGDVEVKLRAHPGSYVEIEVRRDGEWVGIYFNPDEPYRTEDTRTPMDGYSAHRFGHVALRTSSEPERKP